MALVSTVRSCNSSRRTTEYTTSRHPPCHPSLNGLAESAVLTFKSDKKLTEGTLESRVIRFLFHYCTTSHATTGQSPAELMLGRQVKTRLDLLKPDIGKGVRAHQEQQKRAHNDHSQPRELQPGVQVYAKYLGKGPPWLPGVIQVSKGPVNHMSYTVELENGCVFRQHVDHLIARIATAQPSVEMDDYPTIEMPSQNPPIISTSARLRDCIVGYIVPLFDCSLSSLKWTAVTSAVHELSMRGYSPKC